jgi:hypothetical protein
MIDRFAHAKIKVIAKRIAERRTLDPVLLTEERCRRRLKSGAISTAGQWLYPR